MRVPKFTIVLAAVALVGIGTSSSQAGDRCGKYWMAREGSHYGRRMERTCCCCPCGMRGMGWHQRGHRMMMGGREMQRWRSFSAESFGDWLGIETGRTDRGDLTVTRVLPGGPAEKAGLEPQDVLTSVNGVSLVADQRETLAALVRHGFADGKKVTVTVLRAGKVVPIDVTLQAPAGKGSTAPPTSEPSPTGHY